jgi:hypothetical protein
MNLKNLLKIAGVRNDIAKAVEAKAAKTSAEKEREHQERALTMTKLIINEALRAKKEADKAQQQIKQKTIIVPDDK